MARRTIQFLLTASIGIALSFGFAMADEPAANTQAETTPRLTPQQALAALQLPDGFRAHLFASEPDVQQPIGMAWDARGRLWVAENYTYADSTINYDLRFKDRIVILQDADGDHRAETRTVFHSDLQRLTSVEVGFGGVWAMCPPHLLFIPDRDGDDRPDGPPVVMLDGWDDSAARHNFTNGLRWGPDGWLYGRNGILATSRVGTPDTPAELRTSMNCGIWRFHPTRKIFEVVCQGTTNPWGMDWDELGQMYFINTVIGHLWHVVPGAHYRRMYGEDLTPNTYQLIEQTADHFHWDAAAEEWTAQRKSVTEGTSRAGGGHAHSGLMIYLGDNWPRDYRGDMLTVNLHGRRLNRDHLERDGATYIGRHRPDFLTSQDEWFRAIDLNSGPDGGVYILDWSDIGECHENDGVHRTSGRIYKIVYDRGQPIQPSLRLETFQDRSDSQLVAIQALSEEWYVRQARQLLQQRAARGEDFKEVHRELRKWIANSPNVRNQLRGVWCLSATGGMTEEDLQTLLTHENEHLRLWAVRLLADEFTRSDAARAALVDLARREQSGLVLTFLASALQRLPAEDRVSIAMALVQHAEFAKDRVLPLMVWYGLEPIVTAHPTGVLSVLSASRMPVVTECIARRLTTELERQPELAAVLVATLHKTADRGQQAAGIAGMSLALRGWQRAVPPQGWASFASAINAAQTDAATIQAVRELSVVFGDGRAIGEVRKLAADKSQSIESRRQALRALVAARAEGIADLLSGLLTDRDLSGEAVRGLATLNLKQFAPTFAAQFRQFPRPGKDAALTALASRGDAATQLLDAVERDVIPRHEVTPVVLRQVQLLGNDGLSTRVATLFPEQRLIAGDRLQQIAKYRDQLTAAALAAADRSQGRKVYDQHCGKCHKLFGQGGMIGPELTGAQRTNLNYWLENILDPSASVAASYRMSVILLGDGRVVSGVIGEQTDRTLTVQTPTEKIVLERKAIEEIKPSQLSLMPDGQLPLLKDHEVRDLMGYLMSSQQAPLPEATGGP